MLTKSHARRTTHALRYLSRRAAEKKGFFLMIEGSRIDMAAYVDSLLASLTSEV
jgi:alkaline phosphatase